MPTSPYMPFYISDYIADTAHLTTEEHGAYLLLIFSYWQTGKPLPADEQKLARIARLSPKKFKKVFQNVKGFFHLENDFFLHSRIDQELNKFKEKSEKARASAAHRVWKSKGKDDANAKRTHSERITNAKRTLCYSDSDTDNKNIKNKKNIKKNKKVLEEAIREGFEYFWEHYPRRVGGKENVFKKFERLGNAEGVDRLREVLQGLKRQLPSLCARERQFIPHPGTWLNQRRWTDEIDPQDYNCTDLWGGDLSDELKAIFASIFTYHKLDIKNQTLKDLWAADLAKFEVTQIKKGWGRWRNDPQNAQRTPQPRDIVFTIRAAHYKTKKVVLEGEYERPEELCLPHLSPPPAVTNVDPNLAEALANATSPSEKLQACLSAAAASNNFRKKTEKEGKK